MKTNNKCLLCKGSRYLCGNVPCPLLAKFQVNTSIKKRLSRDFFGPSSSIFVGRIGYPNVYIGPMGAYEEKGMSSPNQWFGQDYKDVIESQSVVLRGHAQHNVFSKDSYITDNQLLALSKKPADIEMHLKNKPVYEVRFSDMHQPTGPIGKLNTFKVVDNVKVARKVDAVVSDELKAVESGYKLYQIGEDVYKVTNILSSGALGFDQRKKLVPTRWSITAVDDLITKRLLEDIRQYPSINDFVVFESTYMDNHFVILLMPGNFEFENFEAWAPGSTWSQGARTVQIVEEHEPFQGRKKYADKQAGGYYAARLAVAEFLHHIQRQARVFSIREISERETQ